MGERMSKVKEKVTQGLELPADIILGVPKITIIGESELTVENHKGIIKFETDEVAINTSVGIFRITGSSFEIVFVGGTTITLRGTIKSMVFDEYDE